VKFDFVVANPPYIRQLADYNNKDLFGININESKYSKIYLDNGGEVRI
jgi:tRNA1(Val) A37 N6-methylase TrmN6